MDIMDIIYTMSIVAVMDSASNLDLIHIMDIITTVVIKSLGLITKFLLTKSKHFSKK